MARHDNEVNRARWAELVDEATVALTAVAAARTTLTYADLRDRLPEPDLDLAALLREVSTATDEAGRGLLSAVVVNASGRPGQGWFRLAEARGRDVSEPDRAWRDELERVWAGAAPLHS
jgi:hypothetical protein